MLVKKCICDRCGKEFPEKESKTILFQNASRVRRAEETESKILIAFTSFLKKFSTRDYCPECVTAFKKFLNMKEGAERENGID